MTKPKKKKPTHQKVLMPPSSEPKPVSAKEGSLQAIALCHKLITEAPYSYEHHEQVKAAIGYLEALFTQVKGSEEKAIEPEVASHPKETSLELVNATN